MAGKVEIPIQADRPPPVPSEQSKVEMHELVRPRDADVGGKQLLSGQLLKWIDIAACLSAERHCDMPCVTVSMDGVYFEHVPSVGNVVIIKAGVTRAFETSMEILVHVSCEERSSRAMKAVCKAYLTFIARPKDKTKAKIKLPFVLPAEVDRKEYFLAMERRANRLKGRKEMKQRVEGGAGHVASLLEGSIRDSQSVSHDTDEPDDSSVLYSDRTQVSSIELVLPQHGNHHQSVTFGGQIMEWMFTACFIAASRCLPGIPYIQAIDTVRFLKESHIGDRVSIHAQVNRSFDDRVEVGCRVDARTVGEKVPRHINTSFLILGCHEKDAVLKILPNPNNEDDVRRYDEALVRYQMQLERLSYIRASVSDGLSAIPKWTKAVSEQLIMSNYERVTMWRLHKDWQKMVEQDGTAVFKYQSANEICMRIEMQIPVSAAGAFERLCDVPSRPKWDKLCKSGSVYERLTNSDSIVHLNYIPIPLPDHVGKEGDFVLLMSARTPHVDGDAFSVCFRSVDHPAIPPVEDVDRGMMICSGYILEKISGREEHCKLTYVQQVGGTALKYLVHDLTGCSKLTLRLGLSLCKFLQT